MTSNPYGPDKVCQRTACTADGPADHLGGAHLDPRDRARFDGNGISLQAATYRVRDELTALHSATRGKGELEEIADVAIRAALKEIDFQSGQATHARVNADRQIRESSRRALDCEDHGKTIQALEDQLTLIDQSGERSEKARLALLSGITAFDRFVARADRMVALGQPLWDTGRVVEEMRKVLTKVHASHSRAWGGGR